MSVQPDQQSNLIPARQILAMQIIVFSLVFGVLLFLGIACFVTFGQNPPPVPAPAAGDVAPQDNVPIIAYFAAAMAAMTLVARCIVPGIVARDLIKKECAKKSPDSMVKEDLYQAYQTTLIIATALLEGAALFNIIAIIVERQVLSLGITGLLLVLMAVGFPTKERVDAWCEEQLRNAMLNPPGN